MTTMAADDPISLREYLDERFSRVEQQFTQHQREHQQHDAAHAREHVDSQKAIDTAALLAKENKKDANEWRGAMDDRERTLATKVDIATLTEAVNALKVAEVRRAEADRQRFSEEAEDKLQARDRQSSAQWRIALVVGIAATIGSVLVNVALQLATSPGAQL